MRPEGGRGTGRGCVKCHLDGQMNAQMGGQLLSRPVVAERRREVCVRTGLWAEWQGACVQAWAAGGRCGVRVCRVLPSALA